MLQGLIFLGLILLVLGPVHWYLWKRLVKDTTRPGRGRKIGTWLYLLLPISLVAALAVPRIAGAKTGYAFSLVGYLWLAVLFYLVLIMFVLEIPRAFFPKRIVHASGTPATTASGTPATTTASATGLAPPAPATSTPTSGAMMSADRSAPTGLAHSIGPNAADADPQDHDNFRKDAQILDANAASSAKLRGSSAGAGADDAGVGEVPVLATGRGDVSASPGGVGSAESARGAEAAGIGRRLLLSRGAAIFAGLTATGIVGYGVKTALGDPVLKRIQIPLAKLPRSLDGYKIALVSDIHLGPLTGIAHTERIVRSINGMNADLVAIVGDLVDGSVEDLGDEAAPLRNLVSRDGSYFVTGNHEYFSGAEEWIAEVTRLGIRPLQNERLEIRGLDLAGVNDVTGGTYPGAGGGPDFAKTLGDRDPEKPVILLAHQPVQATEAAKFKVDLQLSGHTHGGQMVPFNYIARLQQPVISGLGEVDGTKVYVTNGAGFWGPPVRVGAPPDITLVELRAG